VTGLTRRQVGDSPSVETEKPVSRQQEMDLHTYYGWQPYWTVPPMVGTLAPFWGPAMPATAYPPSGESRVAEEVAAREREHSDSDLRSAREVEGYHVAASDGEIGRVEDFLLDDRDWAIRLLAIDTGNWLPGRKVVISPAWLRAIDWSDQRILVDLTRHGPGRGLSGAPGGALRPPLEPRRADDPHVARAGRRARSGAYSPQLIVRRAAWAPHRPSVAPPGQLEIPQAINVIPGCEQRTGRGRTR
jgi:hypothetical protein